jgi:putative transposase
MHSLCGMTMPRRVIAGATVMITRRTLRRTHLLRPDRKLNQLFVYVLAVLAARYGMAIHGVVVMSTHEHIVLTDVHGRLPRFLQELHRLLALGIKVLRKWEGAVWDPEKTSVVELCTADAIVEKLAYIMANPVAAGLVEHARQWPGLNTLPSELGVAQWSATRPGYFFDPSNPDWPPSATLQLSAPGCTEKTLPELQREVAEELRALEHDAQVEVRGKGWKFLGAHKLASLSPFARARSWEPLRSLNPTFAVGRHNKQAFFACVARLRAFRQQYRAALELWRRGVREALFPSGTWWMSVWHAASIDAS